MTWRDGRRVPYEFIPPDARVIGPARFEWLGPRARNSAVIWLEIRS
jgi:hypothetical protein